MDKKSLSISLIIFFSVGLTVAATYYKYIAIHDFELVIPIECDPDIENCFMVECTQADSLVCPKEITKNFWYFKYLYINANDVPVCVENNNCNIYTCNDSKSCSVILCSENIEDDYAFDVMCSDNY